MSFGGVDEKKLADAIIDGAREKLLDTVEEMRQATIKELLDGMRGLLDSHDIVISVRPKT